MNSLSWSFYEVWNSSLEERKVKKYEKRDRIWASEMGGAFIDRYLKMTGEAPTNPPDARSLRKFEAGNIWEWIVGVVLKKSGLFIETQKWVEYRYPNMLPVTGKVDYHAGGRPDWEKAWNELEDEHFPEFITKAARGVIENLQESHPNGLKEIIMEVKSCSSYMFDKYYKSRTGNPNHRLQAFHYLKAEKKDEAHVVYISKDDARMLELGVLNPSIVEDEYRADIGTMSNYIKNKGFKNQAEFDEKYKPIVSRWNRVVGRILKGDKMTDNNKQAIEEITIQFPDFEKSIERMKEKNEKT
jgi:hypothetical protein